MKNIVAIVGPTASGKSDLAIALAKKHHGEIISADSRQVYRGMDIGTGKVIRDRANHPARDAGSIYSQGVRHHLLDAASPKRNYNVSHFVKDAKRSLEDIQKRNKLPIICGGTGFWVQTLIEGTDFPKVKPDLKLRKQLERKASADLFKMLKEKDPERAETIDSHNKIRLIRALEIIKTLGSVPKPTTCSLQPTAYLILALNPPKEILLENIKERLKKRLKQGMIKEVERLRKEGLSWKRLESFGLEYKNVALFLQKKISRKQMEGNILRESWHYAKRQLSWLRRWEKQGAKIHWIDRPQKAVKLTEPVASSAVPERLADLPYPSTPSLLAP